MTEDRLPFIYRIKGRIFALREQKGYNRDDLSNYLAPQWNIAPTGARAWIHTLESAMLLDDLGNSMKRVSRPENARVHQQRISDYLAALGVTDERECRAILEGIEHLCPGFRYMQSTVKPLVSLEKAIRSS